MVETTSKMSFILYSSQSANPPTATTSMTLHGLSHLSKKLQVPHRIESIVSQNLGPTTASPLHAVGKVDLHEASFDLRLVEFFPTFAM
jgi:hypothetical protein